MSRAQGLHRKSPPFFRIQSSWDVAIGLGGEIAVTGLFTALGGVPASRFGVLRTPCPAEARIEPLGGCPSSGGSNQLSPTAQPWIGTTYRAEGSGLPARAFVVEVVGLGVRSQPLSQLSPQGQPGCFLMPTPDAVGWHMPTNGRVRTAIPIPHDTGLVGVNLHQQLIPIEYHPAGQVVAITATNRLALTIGSL